MSKHERQRRGGNFIFMIFRMILSLVVLAVLLLASYQAFKSFSGYDPLKLSPQTLTKSLLNNQYLYNLISKALSFDPTNTLSKLQPSASFIPSDNQTVRPSGTVIFSFAVVSDSHNDNEQLEKALSQARESGAKFVVGLGDFSDVGTIEELTAAQRVFEQSGLPFYITSGDHDLWDARNRKVEAVSNFSQVFDTPYSSFGFGNTRFILMFDADNYLGVDETQRKWIEEELGRNQSAKPIFVLTHSPLYHPSSDRVVGKVDSKLKSQADDLIELFQRFNVSQIFAGDVHFYTSYVEPRSNLRMVTAGAVTSTRNAQAPRFLMVDVYDSGEYYIQDTEIK